MNDLTDDISKNLTAVKNKIAAAAASVSRNPETVSLVAVSKVFGADRIRPAIDAGQRLFGENRVQEAEEKWPALREVCPETVLHLIGPLQRNKVKKAVQLFDVIETVDRERLARALADEMGQAGKSVGCFIQVNTGAEPQKAGILPPDADDFIKLCRDTYDLPLRGLMCIPPIDEEPSLHFALLAKIAERNGLKGLSMGMSSDFETAIAFGATHVRVGTAVFGPRPKPVP